MRKASLFIIACLVALSSCTDSSKEEFVVQKNSSSIAMPEQYSDLEPLAAGYINGNFFKLLPWVSLKNEAGDITISYLQRKKWHETVIRRADFPPMVQDCKILAAGYYFKKTASLQARIPWISFIDPQGTIIIYSLKKGTWRGKIITNT